MSSPSKSFEFITDMIENSNLKSWKLFPFREWENSGREELNSFQRGSGRIRFMFYRDSFEHSRFLFWSGHSNRSRGSQSVRICCAKACAGLTGHLLTFSSRTLPSSTAPRLNRSYVLAASWKPAPFSSAGGGGISPKEMLKAKVGCVHPSRECTLVFLIATPRALLCIRKHNHSKQRNSSEIHGFWADDPLPSSLIVPEMGRKFLLVPSARNLAPHLHNTF